MGLVNYIAGQGMYCILLYRGKKRMKQKGFVSSVLALFLDLGDAKISVPSIYDWFHIEEGEWSPYKKSLARPFIFSVA